MCNIYKYICEDGHLNDPQCQESGVWIIGNMHMPAMPPQRWIRGNSFGTTVDTCNMYSKQSPAGMHYQRGQCFDLGSVWARSDQDTALHAAP